MSELKTVRKEHLLRDNMKVKSVGILRMAHFFQENSFLDLWSTFETIEIDQGAAWVALQAAECIIQLKSQKITSRVKKLR